MNPNLPYGQQNMISPHQRRHEMPYGQPPPHMRPRPGYPQYYTQPMGQVIPQYPHHYQQQWYNPYQPHMAQYHAGRPQYYQPPPPPPHHYPPMQQHQQQQQQQQQQPQQQQQHYQQNQSYQQHHGPLVVSSQPPGPFTPRQHANVPAAVPPQPSSVVSASSAAPLHTPPSRPISTTSALESGKGTTSPATTVTSTRPSVAAVTPEPVSVKEPFQPPVPWLSVEDKSFPPRAPRRRRKIPRSAISEEPVVFFQPEELSTECVQMVEAAPIAAEVAQKLDITEAEISTPTQTSTPLSSEAQSESLFVQPTTPSSTTAAGTTKSQQTPTQTKAIRAAVPVLPAVPALPSSPSATRENQPTLANSDIDTSAEEVPQPAASESVAQGSHEESDLAARNPPVPAAPPKSWADLVRSKGAAGFVAAAASTTNTPSANGVVTVKSETLGEVIGEIDVSETPSKIAFLQPRGLVNTGNMCYMNSVLQVLVFCIPFYDFLDQVAKRATHAFKSDTPLIDAMILFTREYIPIDVAFSVDQLRLRLKPEDFEKYGDSFSPEYVYNTINKLPRFRDMRRGHQQDAQEFLGFLLEELHEECTHAVQQSASSNNSGRTTPVGSVSNVSEVPERDGGWMEVGHKQKTAITRSSGAIAHESPVTSIFGGKLRSELKIPSKPMSVTLEPYQPLQLDIGSPQISNIVDALKGLTKPENMQGDFQTGRGAKATATKQVFIETMAPVLILHLKRFHYDTNTKRAEKIWKKVGYPLELEIPKEVFPASARNKIAAHGGLPKYRLTGVIYHHGKNANGGHYTVDIRRQDGREWIRIDDTVIRRIRSDDVAEGGSEEDPKVLAAALRQHKEQGSANGNRFGQIDAEDDEDDDSDKVWNQVNGHSRAKSSTGAAINGNATPSKDASGPQTPRYRESVKDNKVAYLLFYQRISI